MCDLMVPEDMTEEKWQREREVYGVEKPDPNKAVEPLFQEKVFVDLSRSKAKNVFRLIPSTNCIQ